MIGSVTMSEIRASIRIQPMAASDMPSSVA